MSAYFHFFSDIDECTEDEPCDHICTDTVGSFTCSCRDGFELDENGRDCNGKKLCVSGTTYVSSVIEGGYYDQCTFWTT